MKDKMSTFPDRDATKPAEQQGLFRKFTVRRNDGSDLPGGKHHGCTNFVLDLDHDPHAARAMREYANACRESHPLVAADIDARFGPVIDLVHVAHKQIRNTYAQGFGPLDANITGNDIDCHIREMIRNEANGLLDVLLEYFNAATSFNNAHGEGSTVEGERKAEARFDAATQAAHRAVAARGR